MLAYTCGVPCRSTTYGRFLRQKAPGCENTVKSLSLIFLVLKIHFGLIFATTALYMRTGCWSTNLAVATVAIIWDMWFYRIAYCRYYSRMPCASACSFTTSHRSIRIQDDASLPVFFYGSRRRSVNLLCIHTYRHDAANYVNFRAVYPALSVPSTRRCAGKWQWPHLEFKLTIAEAISRKYMYQLGNTGNDALIYKKLPVQVR